MTRAEQIAEPADGLPLVATVAADWDHNLRDGVAGHLAVVQLAGHLVPATDTWLITFPTLPFTWNFKFSYLAATNCGSTEEFGSSGARRQGSRRSLELLGGAVALLPGQRPEGHLGAGGIDQEPVGGGSSSGISFTFTVEPSHLNTYTDWLSSTSLSCLFLFLGPDHVTSPQTRVFWLAVTLHSPAVTIKSPSSSSKPSTKPDTVVIDADLTYLLVYI